MPTEIRNRPILKGNDAKKFIEKEKEINKKIKAKIEKLPKHESL